MLEDLRDTGLSPTPPDPMSSGSEDFVYPDPHNPEEAFDRRQFLAVMGASAALAGAAGCSPRPAPHGEIVPYVKPPEQLTPGVPLHFATGMELAGTAIGLLVTGYEGHPTKVEGNPEHPASLGSTDNFSQASLLGLYDPDRSQDVRRNRNSATWNEAIAVLRPAFETQRKTGGAGLRILSGSTASPTLEAVMAEFQAAFPQAKWVQYEPCGKEATLEGARRAFGQAVRPHFNFANADVVLSLDADFLTCTPGTVRYQRDFADRRRVRKDGKGGIKPEQMNRFYAVETTLSTTGVNAEHRLALKPSQIESFARALAAELKVAGTPAAGALPDAAKVVLGPLARDLAAHRGRSLVLVGDSQSASLHALGNALNHALGNVGSTVQWLATREPATGGHGREPGKTPPAIQHSTSTVPPPYRELAELIAEMKAGKVEVLLILGSNPVYTAAADLPFADALAHVKLSIHHGLHVDETAERCQWHLPEAHHLETWGDGRGPDGTVAIQQPLIEPLYRGRSVLELLTLLVTGVEQRGRDIVREHWRKVRGSPGNFNALWDEYVQKGIVPDTVAKPVAVALSPNWAQGSAPAAANDALEIAFQPDPVLFDGRFANNGWLQELPKPVSKLCWGNAALISPATAAAHNLHQNTIRHGGQHAGVSDTVVELRYRGRSLRIPVFFIHGHADNAITVYLGHGRTSAGRVGNGVGSNAYALRTSDAPGFGSGLEIAATGDAEVLACTQSLHSMADRYVLHHATVAGFLKDPAVAPNKLDTEANRGAAPTISLTTPPPAAERDRRLIPLSLYHAWPYPELKWGMAIDLSVCTGCSACMTACQAENNSPVIGKDQVTRGRVMHWIRVDRYATEEGEFFQPVPCMHCENAPCEYVCPVGATVHSHDGLNDMIYNRCVGTRFCSNNCPYKVRRFNFLSYGDYSTESYKPMRNPEVTVRSRGVMEKCTYCVQRIRAAEIESDRRGVPIPAGRVQTACQQACPSRAIDFGNLNNPAETVVQWKAEPHNYSMLAETNTRPRTTYLAAVRNPNPELG